MRLRRYRLSRYLTGQRRQMHWGEILEKSWNYIRKYKFLWGLGILAALTEGGLGFSNYTGGSWPGDDSQEFGQMADSVSGWVVANIDFIIITLAALFVIALIMLYLSYSARAGLIYSVNSLESGLPAEAMPQALQAGKEKLTFAVAFVAGQKYFWRFLGMTLLIALLNFAAAVVIIGAIVAFVFLALASLWFLIIIIPLGILLISALVFLVIYLNLVLLLGTRALVIEDSGVIASLRAGKEIINDHFLQILLGWLINIGLGFAASLALAIVFVPVFIVLIIIGMGIYLVSKWTGVVIYAVPVGLATFTAFLVVAGIINAYFSAFWTVVYKKLKV